MIIFTRLNPQSMDLPMWISLHETDTRLRPTLAHSHGKPFYPWMWIIHEWRATYVPPYVCPLRVYVPSMCMSPPCVCLLRVYIPSMCMSPRCVYFFVWLFLHVYVASMYMSLRVYVTPCACSFRVYVPPYVCPLCVFVPPYICSCV